MSKRVFLDTNIIADIIDATRANHQTSFKLLEALILREHSICISEDMLSTLYYISKNKTATLAFFKNVIFIDWEVFSFGSEVIREAIEISLKINSDFEDILQCLCAKHNHCSALISNDKKFYNCGINIYSSNEFIK